MAELTPYDYALGASLAVGMIMLVVWPALALMFALQDRQARKENEER